MIEPRYSEEELKQLNKQNAKTYEIDGKRVTGYEAAQMQRRLEREYRKAQTQSDIFRESGNDIKAKDYKSKATAIKTTYDDLTDKVSGLYNSSERMRTYFAGAKPLTNGGGGGIMRISSPISSRKHPTGTPEGIELFGDKLNSRQTLLLDNLPKYDSKIIVSKRKVSMRDLSALTARENVEFAMFTKGNERLIIRGDAGSVNIDIRKAKELAEKGYKWSGHTHPGSAKAVLLPSCEDREILKCFNQKNSVTYNSIGKHYVFGEDEK